MRNILFILISSVLRVTAIKLKDICNKIILIISIIFLSVSSTSALLKSNKSFPNMDHLAVNGELPESASSVKVK